MSWNDNPAGLFTHVPVMNEPDIGTEANPLGTVYARTMQADNIVGDTTLAFNNYLGAISSTGTTLDLLKGDATDNTVLNTPTGKQGKFAVNGVTIGTFDVNSVDFPAFNLIDGSDKNHTIAGVGTGSAYTIPDTAAAIDMGTTDPAIVLNKAGTYLLLGRVNMQYVGATFAANRNVIIKYRRTNNTAADLVDGATTMGTNVTTTVTGNFANAPMPIILYTTSNLNDALTIFVSVSTSPTAGTLQVTGAEIMAIRLF